MTQLLYIIPLLLLQLLQPVHHNILLIGDSEVRYVGWHVKSVQQPNETVFIDSKPGTNIIQWNNGMWWNGHFFNFKSEMAKYPNVDTVIIFLGTNNFNWRFLQPHQNILDEVKRRHLKCIWVGPTNVDARVFHNPRITNPHIISKLLKQDVSSVCTYVDTEQLGIPLVDGVHPTALGAVKWLKAIWQVKKSL